MERTSRNTFFPAFFADEKELPETVEMNPLSLYFSEVKDHQMLTVKEERFLSKIIQNYSPPSKQSLNQESGNKKAEVEFLSETEIDELSQILMARGIPFSPDSFYSSAARELAIQVFAAANLRLVISVAKKIAYSAGLRLEDAIQDGNVGLMQAIEKFEGTREGKFSTYAMYWIIQAIRRGVNPESNLYLPAYKKGDVAKIRRIQRDMMQKTGSQPNLDEAVTVFVTEKIRKRVLREPTESEIKAQFQRVYPEFTQLFANLAQSVKIDGDDNDDDFSEDSSLHHLIGDSSVNLEDDVFTQLLSQQVKELMYSTLFSDEERKIFFLRFGNEDTEEMPIAQIVQTTGLSKKTITHMLEKIYQRVAKIIGEK